MVIENDDFDKIIEEKILEWLWNIITSFKYNSKISNSSSNNNTRFKYPFPSNLPNLEKDMFIRFANEEINECNLFLNNICSKCNNPKVVCIVENQDSFLRYKQLKKCIKKVKTK